MCGRYQAAWDIDRPEIEKIGEIIKNKYPGELFKSGEIFPGDKAVVLVTHDKAPALVASGSSDEKADVRLMRWGYPVSGRSVINARAETAAEKPLFRESLCLRRCVIITTGFYEWTHNDKDKKNKIKYLFRLPDTPVLYLAGFYELRDDEERYIIMTAEANASVREVHDRMPVIVARNEILPWLSDSAFSKRLLKREGPMLVKTAE
jgi:putative SOS response-associated peptidase YedK